MNRPEPALALWRLMVAGAALTGVLLAAREYDVWWTALSQLANLAVAGSFAVLAVTGARAGWLRGCLASTMLLVSTAYLPLANGNLTQAWSLLEHVVTPTLVLVDFVVVAPGPLARWHPPSWLVPPAAYLGWYVVSDLRVYDALDPGRTGVFVAQVALLTGLVLGLGHALAGLGAARQDDEA